MALSLMAALGAEPVSAGRTASYNVLILKNVDAWGSPTIETTLNAMNISYTVMSGSELKNTTTDELVKSYDMIIIASDQNQAFYDVVGVQMLKLEDYVRAGRTLEIHAANWGWGGGLWTTRLPKNVTIVQSYSNSDYVVANNTTLTSSYSSHGYLANPPADAEIITVQAPTGVPDYTRPSTVVYPMGSGWVSVTGLTIEYSVPRGGSEWAAFYRGLVTADLSRAAQPVVPAVKSRVSFLMLNFYYYRRYVSNLERYNTLYAQADKVGIDNGTLALAQEFNTTATAHYEDAVRYGPVLGNLRRLQILPDIRMASIDQKKAVKMLEDAMAGR